MDSDLTARLAEISLSQTEHEVCHVRLERRANSNEVKCDHQEKELRIEETDD